MGSVQFVYLMFYTYNKLLVNIKIFLEQYPLEVTSTEQINKFTTF